VCRVPCALYLTLIFSEDFGLKNGLLQYFAFASKKHILQLRLPRFIYFLQIFFTIDNIYIFFKVADSAAACCILKPLSAVVCSGELSTKNKDKSRDFSKDYPCNPICHVHERCKTSGGG
jgi:hypothetical protein